ncbi:MAG: hypothetical protein GY862_17550 [Gammaproteobacteria bacterium]|nr:hypothetical protein [Gammaproteobacteria bacterium]
MHYGILPGDFKKAGEEMQRSHLAEKNLLILQWRDNALDLNSYVMRLICNYCRNARLWPQLWFRFQEYDARTSETEKMNDELSSALALTALAGGLLLSKNGILPGDFSAAM